MHSKCLLLRASILASLALLFMRQSLLADDWPHWRGPTMNGVAQTEGLATEWSLVRNILWRRTLPGPAGSTPVIAGNRLFLTSQDGAELELLAFDVKTGDPLWQRTVTTGDETFRGDEGNLASPSPSTDGKHVVAVMGDGVMACYSVTGDPIWKVDLSERLTQLEIQFGYSSSPIVHDGKVYLQWVHGEGDPKTEEARVACLDLSTGETIWETGRATQASQECEHSYASPILVSQEAGQEASLLVTHGADYTIAQRLSDGAERWRLGGLNSLANYHPMLRFVATPVADGNLVIIPTAKKSLVVAVSADGRGNLTKGDSERWRAEGVTPDVPSPILHEGLVYLCGENGNLTCLDAQTGELIYRKRTVADRHRASPLLADGKLYLTSRKGVVTVVRTGRDFEILAQNQLGESISSSPIAVDGVLYLRSFKALYAISETTSED